MASALALALLGAGTGSRSEAALLSEARLVEAALNDLRGLVASFTQTVESPALPQPQVERGTVYLLRPGRMRWEYAEPPGKLAVADGRSTHLYLPEDHQVVVAPLSGEEESGISLLLRDRVDLFAEFEIARGERPRGGGARPLRLTPRSPRAPYRHLLLDVGPDHLIRSLVVVDHIGSAVTYRFNDVRPVATLDESLFRFTPPPGVDVQDVAR